jgi:preprotein translocase subunit SecE
MKNPFRAIRIFTGETVVELKKASWPNKKELREYTAVVLVAFVIIGIFISVSDFSLVNWVDFLTRLARSSS